MPDGASSISKKPMPEGYSVMSVKSQSGRTFDLPTPEEESGIQTGIAQDPDTYEVTDAEFRKLKRVAPLGRSDQRTRDHTSVSRGRDHISRLRPGMANPPGCGPSWMRPLKNGSIRTMNHEFW